MKNKDHYLITKRVRDLFYAYSKDGFIYGWYIYTGNCISKVKPEIDCSHLQVWGRSNDRCEFFRNKVAN